MLWAAGSICTGAGGLERFGPSDRRSADTCGARELVLGKIDFIHFEGLQRASLVQLR